MVERESFDIPRIPLAESYSQIAGQFMLDQLRIATYRFTLKAGTSYTCPPIANSPLDKAMAIW